MSDHLAVELKYEATIQMLRSNEWVFIYPKFAVTGRNAPQHSKE